MLENLIALVDCSQPAGKSTSMPKLHSICSAVTKKYNLCVCFLIDSEQSRKNYQQLSKDLNGLTHDEHIIRADTNPKLLFLAKRYIDDKNCEEILILSPSIHVPIWKALVSILVTAAAYRIKFESLDAGLEESVDKPVVDINTFEDDCRQMLMNIDTEEKVQLLKSNMIPQDIFYHGFSTRLGGVSTMPTLKSLNPYWTAAKKDARIVIAENIRRIAEAGGFQTDALHVMRVEHSNKVWEVGTSQPERFDAITTSERNVTIAAPGADCLILLFADPVRKACSVGHSGWRGTLARVGEAVVRKMVDQGSNPKDIRVAFGPGVEGRCYPSSVEKAVPFKECFPSCLIPLEDSENVGIDLFKANRVTLEENGVLPENIDTESAALCTVCNKELLYSYQRDGIPFGNQIGFIGLC